MCSVSAGVWTFLSNKVNGRVNIFLLPVCNYKYAYIRRTKMENENTYVVSFMDEETRQNYVKIMSGKELFWLKGQEISNYIVWCYMVTPYKLIPVKFYGKYHNTNDMLRMEIRDMESNCLIESCYAEVH
jgi:hypothetical protein